MKKFTCKELGGVCDEAFKGETSKEVGEKYALLFLILFDTSPNPSSSESNW